MANSWNIPAWLEMEIRARDKVCVYCSSPFTSSKISKKRTASWEHVINDEKIITRENIALCCCGCNASKGQKQLSVWLQSKYCKELGITKESAGPIIKRAMPMACKLRITRRPTALLSVATLPQPIARSSFIARRSMSKSAFSAKVFALYLFLAGALLFFVPNVLLSIFWIPETSEVWVRVVGLVAFMIGVYTWVAAKHDFRPFFEASVYARFVVFAAFAVFALMGLSSPAIAIFGVVDLLGGLWTSFALRADARCAKSPTLGPR